MDAGSASASSRRVWRCLRSPPLPWLTSRGAGQPRPTITISPSRTQAYTWWHLAYAAGAPDCESAPYICVPARPRQHRRSPTTGTSRSRSGRTPRWSPSARTASAATSRRRSPGWSGSGARPTPATRRAPTWTAQTRRSRTSTPTTTPSSGWRSWTWPGSTQRPGHSGAGARRGRSRGALPDRRRPLGRRVRRRPLVDEPARRPRRGQAGPVDGAAGARHGRAVRRDRRIRSTGSTPSTALGWLDRVALERHHQLYAYSVRRSRTDPTQSVVTQRYFGYDQAIVIQTLLTLHRLEPENPTYLARAQRARPRHRRVLLAAGAWRLHPRSRRSGPVRAVRRLDLRGVPRPVRGRRRSVLAGARPRQLRRAGSALSSERQRRVRSPYLPVPRPVRGPLLPRRDAGALTTPSSPCLRR